MTFLCHSNFRIPTRDILTRLFTGCPGLKFFSWTYLAPLLVESECFVVDAVRQHSIAFHVANNMLINIVWYCFDSMCANRNLDYVLQDHSSVVLVAVVVVVTHHACCNKNDHH